MIARAMRLIARGMAAGRLQTIVFGSEHVPRKGPVLLIARHYHHLFDGLALFAALQRPFHIVVTVDWIQDSLTRYLMSFMTRLARWPVILRADALTQLQKPSVFSAADVFRYQRKGLRDSIDILVAGGVLVIFPEGYPTIDPHYTPKTREQELLPFKRGFTAVLAAAEKRLRGEIPLIPVGVRYRAERKWTAQIAFGAAVKASDFTCPEALVKKLELEVARLSGIDAPSAVNGRNKICG
jgi:putative membrane protein